MSPRKSAAERAEAAAAAAAAAAAEEELEEEELEDTIEAVAAALGAESRRVQLWRREQGHFGPEQFLTSIGTADLSLDYVQEKFGGGSYAAKFCKPSGAVIKSVPFQIAGDPKPPAGGKAARGAELEGDDAPPWARELLRELRGGRKEGSTSTSDFLALAVQLSSTMAASQTALIAPLLEALGKGSRGKDMSPLEMIQLFKEMQELQGSGGSNDSLFHAVGLPLVQALQQFASRGEGPVPSHPSAPPAPQLGAGQEAPPVTENPATPAQPTPAWVLLLRPRMPELLQLARFHGSVEHWGGVIFDRLSDSQLMTLEEELGRADFVREFLAWFPEAAEQRPWFTELFEELSRLLEESRAADGEGGEEEE